MLTRYKLFDQLRVVLYAMRAKRPKTIGSLITRGGHQGIFMCRMLVQWKATKNEKEKYNTTEYVKDFHVVTVDLWRKYVYLTADAYPLQLEGYTGVFTVDQQKALHKRLRKEYSLLPEITCVYAVKIIACSKALMKKCHYNTPDDYS